MLKIKPENDLTAKLYTDAERTFCGRDVPLFDSRGNECNRIEMVRDITDLEYKLEHARIALIAYDHHKARVNGFAAGWIQRGFVAGSKRRK